MDWTQEPVGGLETYQRFTPAGVEVIVRLWGGRFRASGTGRKLKEFGTLREAMRYLEGESDHATL